LEPVQELRSLERSVIQRAGPRAVDVSTDRQAKLIKAARDYAYALAGDDNARFTQLVSSALQQAIAVEKGIDLQQTLAAQAIAPRAMMTPRTLTSTPSTRQELIWETPELQKNFRDLIEKASRPGSGLAPIIGPPIAQRVVGPGSRPAVEGEFPDCVCIGRRLGNTDQYCCTGTLVGRNVVVTAGHCFFCAGGGATGTTVIYVGNDTNQPGQTFTGTIVRHPQYGMGGLHNDLSVIILDQDVEGVTPRPMATTDEINQATFVRVVGFGSNAPSGFGGFGLKRLVDVPVASASCNRPGDPELLGCDPQLEMVAGFVGLGPDSCNGDSGGPIYVLIGNNANDPTAWRVAGATSRATNSSIANCGDGGVYARLDQFIDFIRNIPGARF
jgi:hypothetical protein